MGDYSVKVQNRFAYLLEPLADSESKPPKNKKKAKSSSNNASEPKEAKAAKSQRPEKNASSNSATVPSNAPHSKESAKQNESTDSHNNNKVATQSHSETTPPETHNSSNKSASSSSNTRGGGAGGGTNRNNSHRQNERRFDGNDRSGSHSYNNSNNYNKQERTQQRSHATQSKEVTSSNDVASAVFSNNAPIPQWEDFSASNTKKDNNKTDHLSNGFMRDEFPQVEEFRPDNLDSKNQENDGSNQRNPGGFGNSRPRGGGNFRGGRGFRGAFRGRTFSRGGGGGGFGGNFRNDRGDRPPPFPQSYEGGEIFNNSEMDNNNKDNIQEYGNENSGFGGGGGGGRGGFYGNRRGNYFDSRDRDRFSGDRGGGGGRGGGGNRRYNNYRNSSNNYFDKRRPFDRPPRENNPDGENNAQEWTGEPNGENYSAQNMQNATDRSEQVTGNGAEVVNGGGSVHDQKNPANAAVGEMSSAAPAHEEIGDWNAEVEKEEARRKETGEPALGAAEDTAFMSLEDFEAAQREKQRNTSFDVRKPGEGVNQFEGMLKLNSAKVKEPSTTYPNNPLSSEPGTQMNKSNSGRMTKQNKLDIHFGPAPAKSAQTQRGAGGGNFGGRSNRGGDREDRGYNDRGYGGYGRGRGARRGGGGGGSSGFSDNRRGTNAEGPVPTFNPDTDFPTLGGE